MIAPLTCLLTLGFTCQPLDAMLSSLDALELPAAEEEAVHAVVLVSVRGNSTFQHFIKGFLVVEGGWMLLRRMLIALELTVLRRLKLEVAVDFMRRGYLRASCGRWHNLATEVELAGRHVW